MNSMPGYFKHQKEEIECLKQILEIDDQLPWKHYSLGAMYLYVSQYDNAIPEFEKALEV